MNWQAQVVCSALKCALPFKPTLRQLKRAILGYSPDISNLDCTLEDVFTMMRLLQGTGRTVRGRTVVEIGSGWFPVVPIIYALLGARRVVLTDLHRYMDNDTFRIARDYVMQNTTRIAETLEIESTHISKVLNGVTKPADLKFDYVVPFNETCQNELLGMVDLISSRTVLEHIPAATLPTLLSQWKRLLSGDGVMVHAIDMSDHFEHKDKSISRINYLCFNPIFWQLINAVADYQNRLRHSHFMTIFAKAGLNVVAVETRMDQRARADAIRLKLAPPFKRMTPDDIAILTSYLILNSGASSETIVDGRIVGDVT